MIEFLRSIPGPRFLLLFPLLVALCLAVARFAVRGDRSGDGAFPEPSRFTPAAIAALRGGWELVLKTVIFSLWQRGDLEIVTEERGGGFEILGRRISLGSAGKPARLLRRVEGREPPADRVERAVLIFLRSGRRPEEFFRDATLRSFVETYCASMGREFQRLGLQKSAAERKRSWLATLGVIAVTCAIGGTKLLLGLLHHRPTGFLLLMLAAALPVVFLVMRPAARLTPRGKAFLKRLEEHFGWLKEELGNRQAPAMDPAYVLAVFGAAAVAGTLLYAPFGEAFPARQPGGCGGGSCGGSGCGGGGCGGGGCGGCGGGD